MKVNCLSCGHNIDLDDSYSDYEGAIKCYACNATLDVAINDGNIRSVRIPDRRVMVGINDIIVVETPGQ